MRIKVCGHDSPLNAQDATDLSPYFFRGPLRVMWQVCTEYNVYTACCTSAAVVWERLFYFLVASCPVSLHSPRCFHRLPGITISVE